MPDDGFAGRANRQRLLQFFAAAARNPRDFRRKTFDMLSLFLQKTARDQQRKVGVHPRRFP